jgi:adenylate cyclase
MTIDRTQKVLAQDPSNGSALGFGAASLAAMGDSERAREWTKRALLMDPDNLTMRWNLVCGLTKNLNDNDAALELLGSFAEQLPPAMVKYLRLDTDLDPLRHDPRFEALVAREEQRIVASKSDDLEIMVPNAQPVS